jgi:hypothetical protein
MAPTGASLLAAAAVDERLRVHASVRESGHVPGWPLGFNTRTRIGCGPGVDIVGRNRNDSLHHSAPALATGEPGSGAGGDCRDPVTDKGEQPCDA